MAANGRATMASSPRKTMVPAKPSLPKLDGFFRHKLWSDNSVALPGVADLTKAAAVEQARLGSPARAAPTPPSPSGSARQLGSPARAAPTPPSPSGSARQAWAAPTPPSPSGSARQAPLFASTGFLGATDDQKASLADSDAESGRAPAKLTQAALDPETPLVRRRLRPKQSISPPRPTPTHLKRMPGLNGASLATATPVRKRPAAAMELHDDDEDVSLEKALAPRQRRSSSVASAPAALDLGGAKPRRASAPAALDLGGAKPRRSSTARSTTMRRGSWQQNLRALALTDVPIHTLVPGAGDDEEGKTRRSKRLRLQPLESWRNESLIYERPKGSQVPSICGVALNLRVTDDECHVERLGVATEALRSQTFSLPPWVRGTRPHTVLLAPACGVIHVLRGAIAFAYEGEELEEAVLKKGDSAALQYPGRTAFVAPACYSTGGESAQFWWVEVSPGAALVPR